MKRYKYIVVFEGPMGGHILANSLDNAKMMANLHASFSECSAFVYSGEFNHSTDFISNIVSPSVVRHGDLVFICSGEN